MNDLLNKIKGLVLRDIITVGYCENMDDHLRYRPLLDVMYLEFEGFTYL